MPFSINSVIKGARSSSNAVVTSLHYTVTGLMHQSIPEVPIPPGICSRSQSRGWGIRNFIAARGLGVSVSRGDPRAFDTREFIGKNEAFVKDVRQGLEKLVDVFKDMFLKIETVLQFLSELVKICFLNFKYCFITYEQINIIFWFSKTIIDVNAA